VSLRFFSLALKTGLTPLDCSARASYFVYQALACQRSLKAYATSSE